jgi:2-phospho-L-lactate transferase/gluconeogenesis factor (CofD/UPF0052 family)
MESYQNCKGCFGPELVIFSGGTAFNSVVKQLSTTLSTRVSYILPVSDSGGSTKEIIKVVGGPAIGDIRSRLVRLADGFDDHYIATKHVLEHRLTTESNELAKAELVGIMTGLHSIWHEDIGSSSDLHSPASPAQMAHSIAFNVRKQTLIAFLDYFFKACESIPLFTPASSPGPFNDVDSIHSNIISCGMDYRGGSIGNFVLTGARLFFKSLSSAIHWFSTLAGLPGSTCVIPVIDANEMVNISARLRNGEIIIGQDEISHPVAGTFGRSGKEISGSTATTSPILRIFYSDRHGSELFPTLNKSAALGINKAKLIVYGMGSLYTSIVPSLIVPGIGSCICSQQCKKVLLLNGTVDRETANMDAVNYVAAVVRAICQSYTGNLPDSTEAKPHQFQRTYSQQSPLDDLSDSLELLKSCLGRSDCSCRSAITDIFYSNDVFMKEECCRILRNTGITLHPTTESCYFDSTELIEMLGSLSN